MSASAYKHWIEPAAVDVPPGLAAAVGGHPLVAQTLARRGITDAERARRFLNPDIYQPQPPLALPDMEKAVERIEHAIRQGESILVWGDFDVDGQTSTTLLVEALRALGGNVTYHIPGREAGHGVHVGDLARLLDAGARLVITCDTGVSAHDAVEYTTSRGVDVIITDHHQLPASLPAAYAVIDPQRLGEGHPLRALPGVGCAYKLVEELYTRTGRADETARFLDLVALGIVADVAAQVDDTRYLLQRGLAALRATTRLGLLELMPLADIVPEQITEENISFGLAPRLNALGRLGDANEAVDLLTTDDLERARLLANRLEALNAERKMLLEQVYQGALAQVESDPTLLNYGVLVLEHDRWPGGVIGIAATRLAEDFNRPVILFNAEPDGMARGSARSVAGIDITAAIAAAAESEDDLLHGYGGHTMAAGLSLETAKIPVLRRALSKLIRAQTIPEPSLEISGYVGLGEVSPALLEDLGRLAPFGAGNPALVLAARRLVVKSWRALGRGGGHMRVTVQDEAGYTQDVVWWNAGEVPGGLFDLAYTLGLNTYKGERQLQLVWVAARLIEEQVDSPIQRRVSTVLDYRAHPDPAAALAELRAQYPDLMVWGEGEDEDGPETGARRRDKLEMARALAVWTIPPGPETLKSALRAVRPQVLALFGVDPQADSMNGFLQRLAGRVRYVMSAYEGVARLAEVAASMAQREETIRTGLMWMASRGHIRIAAEDETTVTLVLGRPQSAGSKRDTTRLNETTTQLAEALRETAFYRGYYLKADKEVLAQI